MCGCTLNHLYFVLHVVLVNSFPGTTHARTQTSVFPGMPIIARPLPIKVKFQYASPVNPSERFHGLTQQLKSQCFNRSICQVIDVVGSPDDEDG